MPLPYSFRCRENNPPLLESSPRKPQCHGSLDITPDSAPVTPDLIRGPGGTAEPFGLASPAPARLWTPGQARGDGCGGTDDGCGGTDDGCGGTDDGCD